MQDKVPVSNLLLKKARYKILVNIQCVFCQQFVSYKSPKPGEGKADIAAFFCSQDIFVDQAPPIRRPFAICEIPQTKDIRDPAFSTFCNDLDDLLFLF